MTTGTVRNKMYNFPKESGSTCDRKNFPQKEFPFHPENNFPLKLNQAKCDILAFASSALRLNWEVF